MTAGREVAELRIDLDASVVIAHSEKEQAAATFKGTFGDHPMLATLDNTGEFLAAVLRPGNAGANNAADHISVLDQALAQLPDEHRHGTPILIRTDTAGATKAFLAHVIGLREHGMHLDFSVGWRLGTPGNTMHQAIAAQPRWAWVPAVDEHGDPVEHAGVVELNGQLLAFNPRALVGYPSGMRIIVRRERPPPGAQLDLFEHATGWRYTAFATTTKIGNLAWLDPRHRAHARVEDRIRCAKDTGMNRFPSRDFAINHAWLVAVMIAVDLLAFAQTTVLHDQPDLAKAEPKTLRYRLLHVAARVNPRTTTCPAPHQPRMAVGHRARRRVPSCPRPAATRDLNRRHRPRRAHRSTWHQQARRSPLPAPNPSIAKINSLGLDHQQHRHE